jgi:gluconate 2-dehydrogenase gamma chain
MFSDPMHGGNADLVGWQMIGYPGPLMSYRNDIDSRSARRGGASRRLEQVLKRPVSGWKTRRTESVHAVLTALTTGL